ncbi:hypothetical protein RHSIM_Rhsim03G0229400 [Rhododendron simsii]|uniref:Uncharacterized protein n=1 Tax=Rhododendron simsii TaxID=118357 RepID=A0A834H6M4_RHOSS|nr:hypothetical protein RHSIM_Rhsim03G0229400 [Rhododendron simsii]
MGRSPCCSKEGLNRGAWTATEDKILKDYITLHGEGKWRNLPKRAGLMRCGKSCRLRWLNYLRPDIKRGNISHDEEELIIRLHKLLGNRPVLSLSLSLSLSVMLYKEVYTVLKLVKHIVVLRYRWSLIAGRLPGRTDNEIKNYWNTNLCKKLKNPKQSSDHHHEKKNKISKSKNNMDPQPKKESSNVVRTKAVRCSSKVLMISTTPPVQPDKKTDQPMANTSSMDNKQPMDIIVREVEDNNNSSGVFAFDADIGEGDVWLSGFLNPEELLMISHEENTMEDWSGNSFLDQPNSNPHDLTSFLEYGGDWLADN